MAKSKSLAKIKIHHNRWLIWAIAYVLFMAVALVGYMKISDLNIDSNSVDTNPATAHSYKDARLGFQVRYPAEWSIESNPTDGITFLPSNTSDEGVNVNVMSVASESIFRKTLDIDSESKITVDDVQGKKIINMLSPNHSETVVLVSQNGKLYAIRGSENLVQKILPTFRFINK